MILRRNFWLSFIILPLFPIVIPSQVFAQSDLESGIEEISNNQFVDEYGYVHVLGEIRNKLATQMNFVKVNVAYYDSQNRIIGSDFVYSDPSTIFPGQSATYQALTSASSLASNDVSTVKVRYEYQIDGNTHQSLSATSRPITSNSGQSSGEQNDLTSNTPLGPINPDCGKVIHGIYNLTSDFNCNGDGLIVGEDDTVVYLNGHSMNGPGADSATVGISVPHSNNVKIKGPGKVENFQAGILISGSQNTEVSRTAFEGNKIAVFITGSLESNVSENAIASNSIGVATHSSNQLHIGSNFMTANTLAGATLINTDLSLIDSNSIKGSKNGIYPDSQSSNNRVTNNTLANDIDLNNADGLVLKFNKNAFDMNNCSVSNPTGYCSLIINSDQNAR